MKAGWVGALILHLLGAIHTQGEGAAVATASETATPAAPVKIRFEEIARMAEEGNADAQNYLGDCSVYGIESQPQNFTNAVRWYRKAAVQGHALAQFNLGLLYETGKGVATQYSKAFEWYGKAAAAGQPDAQAGLGLLYLKGLGVKRDDIQARSWFQKAAAATNAEAAYQLGVMDREGLAGEKSGERAIPWFFEAAIRNHAEAMGALGALLIQNRTAETRWGRPEVWLQGAATQDVAQAQYLLAQWLEKQPAHATSGPESLRWYRRAAELNHIPAQVRYAELLRKDTSNPSNAVESAMWYRIAAETGDLEAQTMVGLCFLEGRGLPRAAGEGVKWLKSPAEKGYAKAQFHLGQALLQNEGLRDDGVPGNTWIQRSADQGFAEAQFLVFDSMRQTNRSGAEIWLERAAVAGWPQAQYALGALHEARIALDPVLSPNSEPERWYRSAATQGHVRAQTALGRWLRKTPPPDSTRQEEGIQWLRRAADAGDPEAMHQLALLPGLSQDQAHSWLLRSAELKFGPAARQLGLELLTTAAGGRDERNFESGAAWLSKAVAWNDVEAAYDLSLLYGEGLGVIQDRTEARTLLRKASRGGSERARLRWLEMYRLGEKGVGIREVIYWLRQAEEQGSATAAVELAKLRNEITSKVWTEAEPEKEWKEAVRRVE